MSNQTISITDSIYNYICENSLREDENLSSQAKGSDPDIIVASAKAYINALNKLIFKKTKSTNEQVSELKIEGV